MAVAYKVCVDCEDPHTLAAFWAEALDYVVEDHSALIRSSRRGSRDPGRCDHCGRPAGLQDGAAVRDPDAPVDPRSGSGLGGRVLFQVVPEGNP